MVKHEPNAVCALSSGMKSDDDDDATIYVGIQMSSSACFTVNSE